MLCLIAKASEGQETTVFVLHIPSKATCGRYVVLMFDVAVESVACVAIMRKLFDSGHETVSAVLCNATGVASATFALAAAVALQLRSAARAARAAVVLALAIASVRAMVNGGGATQHEYYQR